MEGIAQMTRGHCLLCGWPDQANDSVLLLVDPPRCKALVAKVEEVDKPREHMLTNKKTIHVEWGDCDPAGILYYPRYFAYFDNCTAALFEAAGLPKHQMLKVYGIIGIPMVDTRARFLAPSHLGDQVVVESSISEWRRSSFDVQHKFIQRRCSGSGVLGNPRLGSALKGESRDDRGSACSANT